MNKEEAILILATCKPYLAGLISFDFQNEPTPSALEILMSAQEILKAGFFESNEIFKLAGYTILEAALLTGILEQYSREHSEGLFNQTQFVKK